MRNCRFYPLVTWTLAHARLPAAPAAQPWKQFHFSMTQVFRLSCKTPIELVDTITFSSTASCGSEWTSNHRQTVRSDRTAARLSLKRSLYRVSLPCNLKWKSSITVRVPRMQKRETVFCKAFTSTCFHLQTWKLLCSSKMHILRFSAVEVFFFSSVIDITV